MATIDEKKLEQQKARDRRRGDSRARRRRLIRVTREAARAIGRTNSDRDRNARVRIIEAKEELAAMNIEFGWVMPAGMEE